MPSRGRANISIVFSASLTGTGNVLVVPTFRLCFAFQAGDFLFQLAGTTSSSILEHMDTKSLPAWVNVSLDYVDALSNVRLREWLFTLIALFRAIFTFAVCPSLILFAFSTLRATLGIVSSHLLCLSARFLYPSIHF
jgi:hypothetical protein